MKDERKMDVGYTAQIRLRYSGGGEEVGFKYQGIIEMTFHSSQSPAEILRNDR
jgi:hypothetical protein